MRIKKNLQKQRKYFLNNAPDKFLVFRIYKSTATTQQQKDKHSL